MGQSESKLTVLYKVHEQHSNILSLYYVGSIQGNMEQ